MGVLAVVAAVSACVVTFGIGWDVYWHWLGTFPSRYDKTEAARHGRKAWLLTVGMVFGLLGALGLIGFLFPESRTRIDATGIETRVLWRRRAFAWHEIADIYIQEYAARGSSRYLLRGRLHSGKRFSLPGLLGSDVSIEVLQQLHDELGQRIQSGA
ncbi:hypothetical protein GCM10029978_100600 [Actinoallomurus acanthiterrae]